jgi:tetratricopeptide (TPR) repeat protein
VPAEVQMDAPRVEELAAGRRVAPGTLTALLRELAAPEPEEELDSAPVPELRPGDVVARFELVRELGRGGFGVVYEARDLELGRAVAFKAVRTGARRLLREERLIREAEAAAALAHPNVVTLFDLGRGPQGPYLVFELLPGETLGLRLARGPLPLREALRVATDVARGLAHAHARGVVHRDLTPANVFLCDDGRVKVLDLGLAAMIGRGAVPAGTPAYMSPEQRAGGQEDARSDVFALGLILHEMIAGRLPGPRGPARLGAGVGPLVRRMTSEAPALRPADGAAVLAELEALAGRGARTGGVARTLAVAAATALLAAGIAALVLGSRPPPASRARTVVAVADAASPGADPAAEVIAGLLSRALEQSPDLHVLPRGRLVDLAEAAAPGAGRQLSPEVAREAARLAGAEVLVLPEVLTRDGERVVAVRGVDAVRGAPLFAFEERAGWDDLRAAILGVSARTRIALGERAATVQARTLGGGHVHQEAWRRYFRGAACVERFTIAGSYDTCLADLREATALDPRLAEAHLTTSWVLFMQGRPRESQRTALEPALAAREEAPPALRPRLDGWAAFLAGRDLEAKALLRAAAEGAPQDKLAWFLAAELPFHRDEWAEAIPLLRRAHALDPAWTTVTLHLAFALGSTGQDAELWALAARLEALGSRPGPLAGLCYVSTWTDPARAPAICTRAVDAGAGVLGQELLAISLMRDPARLEAQLARMSGGPEALDFAWYARLLLAAQRGRWGEVHAAATAAGDPEDPWFHNLLAEALAGSGDRERVGRASARTLELDPNLASNLAVHLAWLGDLERAKELERYLPPGSPRHRAYEALVRWRGGDLAGALPELRAIAAASPLSFDPAIPFPLFVLGEALVEAGRDAEAVEALRRFERMPIHYPSWTYPRSLYLRAVAEERLGDLSGARATARELLELWRDAAPGQPLLGEARALGARLGVPQLDGEPRRPPQPSPTATPR